MKKDARSIQDMFDRIAAKYNLLNSTLSLGIDRIWRKKTIERLQIKSRDRILDIATGTGDLAFMALDKIQDCHVIGIDLSEKMLRIANKRRSYKKTREGLSLVKGDASNMPFKEGTFDSCMVAFGIRNIPDIEGLLRQIWRVLKDQGKVSILEFSIPKNPLIRWGYLFYLKWLMPSIGGAISGERNAYQYLRDSIIGFYPPEKITDIVRDKGFKPIESLPILFGICHLYVIEK